MNAGEIVGLVAGCAAVAGIFGGFLGRVWKGGGKWQSIESKLGGIENELKRVVEEIHGLREDRLVLTTTVARVDEHERRLNRLAP